ncbi:hypothetical protein CBM2587_A160429 [Cupriavidus taiwanensis]|uniref:Uncharacterized protein n=1 Tax=Cupriavidus taiwanensis TaxID=164546 RepID=A0A975WW87_9BURK|nr:hypothetical protein CBM2587_A160429 [Cupriavidus taiwanensis]
MSAPHAWWRYCRRSPAPCNPGRAAIRRPAACAPRQRPRASRHRARILNPPGTAAIHAAAARGSRAARTGRRGRNRRRRWVRGSRNGEEEGFLPSPACGRGAGGEGGSLDEVKACASASAGPIPQPLSRKRERGAG